MDIDRLAVTPDLKSRLEVLMRKTEGLTLMTKLLGDASTRVFLRLFFESGNTAIAMCYPRESISEASVFVEIQDYLSELNLPVPSVLAGFDHLGILILDDLGDNLLETAISDSDPTSKYEMYEKAVDLIVEMIHASASSPSRCSAHSLAFDFDKLSFEMDFFIKHFVSGFLGVDLDSRTEKELRESLYVLCRTLAQEPRFFVHRDYHARNIMVHNEKLFMIDFQDARMGPIQYDLASLLRDSYVTLDKVLIHSLVQRFFEATCDLSGLCFQSFRSVFDMMSLQRNVKALGTFGYQTTVRRTDRYRSSIDRTISYIIENLTTNKDLIGNTDIILHIMNHADNRHQTPMIV